MQANTDNTPNTVFRTSPAAQLLSSLSPPGSNIQRINFQALLRIPEPDPINLAPSYPFFPTFRDEIRMIQMTFGPISNPTPNHTLLLQFCHQILDEAKEAARRHSKDSDIVLRKARRLVGEVIYLAEQDKDDLKETASLIDSRNREKTEDAIHTQLYKKLHAAKSKLDESFALHTAANIQERNRIRLTKAAAAMATALVTKCGVINSEVVYAFIGYFNPIDLPKHYSWIHLVHSLVEERDLREAFAGIVIEESPYPVPESVRIALDLDPATSLKSYHVKRAALAALWIQIQTPEKLKDLNQYCVQFLLNMSHLMRKGVTDSKSQEKLNLKSFQFDETLKKKILIDRHGCINPSKVALKDHPGFAAAAKTVECKDPHHLFKNVQERLFQGSNETKIETDPETLIRLLVDIQVEGQVLLPGKKEDRLLLSLLAFNSEVQNPFLPFSPPLNKEKRNESYAHICEEIRRIAHSVFSRALQEVPTTKPNAVANGEKIAQMVFKRGVPTDEQVNVFNFVYANFIEGKVSRERAIVFHGDVRQMEVQFMPMTFKEYCTKLLESAHAFSEVTSEHEKKQNQRLLRCYILTRGLSQEHLRTLWEDARPLNPALFSMNDSNYCFFIVYDPVLSKLIPVARSRDGSEVHILDEETYDNITLVEKSYFS